MSRSSISAGTISTGMPADSNIRRRLALFEASTNGSGKSHSDMSGDDQPAPFGEERHDGGGRLLDRAARDVDDRPIMPDAQPTRECDLLGDGLAVHIGIVLPMRPEAEQAPWGS